MRAGGGHVDGERQMELGDNMETDVIGLMQDWKEGAFLT